MAVASGLNSVTMPVIFAVLFSTEMRPLSYALPLANTADNLSSGSIATATNRSTDLLASHQDLHPVRVPDDSTNVAINVPHTEESPVISAFPDLHTAMVPHPAGDHMEQLKMETHGDSENQKAALSATPADSPSGLSKITNTPDDTTSDRVKPRVARELLPSIVASGNKELSTNPVGHPQVPPAAMAQASGELPKTMIPNPFGSSPAVIPVDIPPATPVQPVKRVEA